ncbi:hypothetical protein ACWC09_37250 [Streptomyces sp. NPDC001617]
MKRRVCCWALADPDGRFGDPASAQTSGHVALVPETTGTRLRQVARIGPGRSGTSVAIDRNSEREEAIVAFRVAELRTNMEDTLRGVKALAEQAGWTLRPSLTPELHDRRAGSRPGEGAA